jgi:uncharacterized protein (DUF486 family)
VRPAPFQHSEFALTVPANRIGHLPFSGAELKTIRKVITLPVFAVFRLCT